MWVALPTRNTAEITPNFSPPLPVGGNGNDLTTDRDRDGLGARPSAEPVTSAADIVIDGMPREAQGRGDFLRRLTRSDASEALYLPWREKRRVDHQ